MARRIMVIAFMIAVSALVAACERPAPGTPLPTVTPWPTITATKAPSPTSAAQAASPTKPSPAFTPASATSTLLAAATLAPTLAAPAPTGVKSATAIAGWPQRPDKPADYAEAIRSFLNSSPVNIVRLRPMLWAWGAISERLGGILEADLDGDSQVEWIVALAEPSPAALTVPGDLLVLKRQENDYRLLHQLAPLGGEDVERDDVTLLAARDINADGKAEVVYTTTTCGAHTCVKAAHILAWDGKGFRSLAREPIEMDYAEVTLENRDATPPLEIVLHGGTIGSVGAGPQRTRTEIYAWDGSYYTRSKVLYDESDFRYFRVVDANAALLAGEYKKAIALYEEAINNQTLRSWTESADTGKKERADLVAFSRFRLMLTWLLAKDEIKAKGLLEELQREQPMHVYAQAAQVFWDAYLQSEDITAACDAVTAFAHSHPEAVDALSNFGYGNPSLAPEAVCPIGPGKP